MGGRTCASIHTNACTDGQPVTLHVWDVGGQSMDSQMMRLYVRGAHAVLLVYDVTNYNSFRNLEVRCRCCLRDASDAEGGCQDWYSVVQRCCEGKKLPYIALVGNKSALHVAQTSRVYSCERVAAAVDMLHMKAVKLAQHSEFAKAKNIHQYLVSARTGDQVDAMLLRVSATIMQVTLTKADIEVTTVRMPSCSEDDRVLT
jgi:Ras-related protein Rab-28